MKLQTAFMSQVAALALAAFLAQGAAMAQDGGDHNLPASSNPVPVTMNDVQAPQTTINTTSGQATGTLTSTWGVSVDPLLPIGLVGGLGALYAGFVLLGARRGMRSAWIRASVGAAGIALLLNPEILQEDRLPLSTQIAVVVDKSASQMLDGRNILTQAAYEALAAQLNGLDHVEIRLIEAGDATAGQDGTNLFGALQAGLSDIAPERLGAVILLTDGRVHDATALPATIQGVPLHILISGREAGEVDRRIAIERAPAYGMVEQEELIRFRVVDDGVQDAHNEKINVIVRSNGEIIDRIQVTPGKTQDLRIQVPQTGRNVIELEAETLAGELTEINNRVAVTIEGVRDTMRVLLLSGRPNVSERAWRDLLKTDPAVDLVHFSIMRPADLVDDVPLDETSLIPLPTQEVFEQKLGEFDLVIFDHYEDSGMIPARYLQNLADYVQAGGALMVSADPGFAGKRSLYNTPLGAVLPAQPSGDVVEAPFHPAVNDLGGRHPVTRDLGQDAQNMASGDSPIWGRWLRMVRVNALSGHVVMEGEDDAPLLILDRKGQGRVAMLASDMAWLWARGYEGGGPYESLTRRVSHWLMKEPALEEEALRILYQNGELIVERQTLKDDVQDVKLFSPSGTTQQVTLSPYRPGIWRASVKADELGLYIAEQNDAQARTNVGPANPREYQDTLASAEILRPYAQRSGGLVAYMGDANRNPASIRLTPVESPRAGQAMSGNGWMGVHMRGASDLQDVKRWPLLGGWQGLALAVGLILAMWWREGGGTLRRKTPSPANDVPKQEGPKQEGLRHE